MVNGKVKIWLFMVKKTAFYTFLLFSIYFFLFLTYNDNNREVEENEANYSLV